MRYIIALIVAVLIVAMVWPYLRQFAPQRPQASGVAKPASKGELIWLAILATVVLSFTLSTMLWIFGR
jgi:hypothetical protein